MIFYLIESTKSEISTPEIEEINREIRFLQYFAESLTETMRRCDTVKYGNTLNNNTINK